MSLSYINDVSGRFESPTESSYKDSKSSHNFSDEDYYLQNNGKFENSIYPNTTISSSNTNSLSLDSHKYTSNLKFSSGSADGYTDNAKYPSFSRSDSVVIHDSFKYESFYDILQAQIVQREAEDKIGNTMEYCGKEKDEQEDLLGDDFTVKDLSGWLLNKKNTFDDNFVSCQKHFKKLQDCKELTAEQMGKQIYINKIRNYMTEYYKLLDKQNESTDFNPLRVIRDRELKLQTHTLASLDETKNLSDTTKNFQRLMKNYQNVVKDPPSIPVLTFTKRYEVRGRFENDMRERHLNEGFYSKDNSFKNDYLKSPKKHEHSKYYRLNYGSKSNKAHAYQYWKWFVGVNERFEDITLQKVFYLKKDFMGRSQERSKLLSPHQNSSSGKESRANTNEASLFDELYSDNEEDAINESPSEEDSSIFLAKNDSCAKIIQKVQDTIRYLDLQKKSKLEKIVYLEAVLKILVQKSQRFQIENEKNLDFLLKFQIPDIKCLDNLLDETKLVIPTCERLTKISEDNELKDMGIQLTTIQSEINTSLQLRLKKITINDEQLNGDDLGEKGADGTSIKRRNLKTQSKITTLGFYLIELIIKMMLISIRILYTFYSLFCFSGNEKNVAKD